MQPRTKHYTAMASPGATEEQRSALRSIAGQMADEGWTLRAVGFNAGELEFERGAGVSRAEVYLPDARMRGPGAGRIVGDDPRLRAMTQMLVPNWATSPEELQRGLTACTAALLGAEGEAPSRMLIAFVTRPSERFSFVATMCRVHSIDAYNVADRHQMARLRRRLWEIAREEE